MSEFFKPFPQIPHDRHYEGEVNPSSVKPADSVFFTSSEKVVLERPALLPQADAGKIKIPTEKDAAAFKLVGDVLNSQSIKPLEKQIGSFVALNYPQNLQSLRGVLSDAKPSDPVLLQRKTAFEKAIDKEFAPPEGMRIKYRFHEHFIPSAEDFEAIKDHLKDHVKSFFVKGEANVFIGEDANGFMGKDNSFQDGLKKYGTHKKAFIYCKIYRQSGKIPDDVMVQATYNNHVGKTLPATTPQDRYQWAEFTAMDELLEEGYTFEYKKETGVKEWKNTRLDQTFDTLFEYQEFERNMVEESQERDRRILKMVREIEKKRCGKTNIFIAMGAYHMISTISVFPMRYGPITEMDRVISWNPADNPQNEIFRRIAFHEAIPDELWLKGFADFNRAYFSKDQ